MRTQWLSSVTSVLLFAAMTTLAHAEKIEDIPLLLPFTTLVGDCGPVARCFPFPDDLKSDTAVIGSSGQVSIFTRQSTGAWQLTATLLDPFAPLPRPEYNSNFGYVASINSGLLAVAAVPENSHAPVIYIYSLQQSQWSLRQTIQLSYSFGDTYLKELDIQRGRLVVSQIEYAADRSGRVEAKVLSFTQARDGLFRLQQQLNPAANQSPSVAYHIATEGHTLAISAPGDSETPGVVYLYHRNESSEHSSWYLQQVLQPQLSAAAQFGAAISLSGDELAIGAPGVSNPPPTLYPGVVYIYHERGNHWTLRDRIVDPVTESDPPSESNPPPSSDPFGTVLALSGQRLLVTHITNAWTRISTEILFERQGGKWERGTWTPVARLGDIIVDDLRLAGPTALVREEVEGGFSIVVQLYTLPPLATDSSHHYH